MGKKIREQAFGGGNGALRTYSTWQEAVDNSLVETFKEFYEIRLRYRNKTSWSVDGDGMFIGDFFLMEEEEKEKIWSFEDDKTKQKKFSKSLSGIFEAILKNYPIEQFKEIYFESRAETKDVDVELYEVFGKTKEGEEIQIGKLFSTYI